MRVSFARIFFSLVLILIAPQAALAQVGELAVPSDPIGSIPEEPLPSSCEIFAGVTITPCNVTVATPAVTVTFTDFENARYLCYKSDLSKCKGGDFKEIKEGKTGATITETVCGDGKERLKGPNSMKGKDCDPEGDYFHQGKVYSLGLYSDKNQNSFLTQAYFFIGREFPDFNVYPAGERRIRVVVANKEKSSSQKYTVALQGRNVSFGEEQCFEVKKGESFELSLPSSGPLQPGKYIVALAEPKTFFPTYVKNNCKGVKFTYYNKPITVPKTGPIEMGKTIEDPYHQERREQGKLITKELEYCAEKDANDDCIAVNVALLGKVGVKPEIFITRLFQTLIGVGSISASIIFVIAGYKILTSRGNKETVGEAREQITAVVLGILFLVLAIALFEFIGYDILRIPGITR